MDSISRARLALEGLSVGDAFGERFFLPPAVAIAMIERRATPRGPWPYTDDTEMALGIVDVLADHGRIDRDALARTFAHRYVARPGRGYGGMAHEILGAIARGAPWRETAGAAFDGTGSMGNGGAMRAAPVGAFFADGSFKEIKDEARASAEPTHANPEGQAGAIAVAVAAAVAWQTRDRELEHGELIRRTVEHTPPGPTRDGLGAALALPANTSPQQAAEALGNGSRVISQDTVPFALWCAARSADDFEQLMWLTVSGLGDRDTTCAIAGGIIAMRVGLDGIPGEWRRLREQLA